MENELVGLVPLVGSDIHLKCLNILTSLDEELFGLIILSDLGEVYGNLNLVRSHSISWLVLDQLDSSVPVSCLES